MVTITHPLPTRPTPSVWRRSAACSASWPGTMGKAEPMSAVWRPVLPDRLGQ
ncbi:MAG: hypothetical protein ABR922_21500 [Streptosporangiaceae bacterium]